MTDTGWYRQLCRRRMVVPRLDGWLDDDERNSGAFILTFAQPKSVPKALDRGSPPYGLEQDRCFASECLLHTDSTRCEHQKHRRIDDARTDWRRRLVTGWEATKPSTAWLRRTPAKTAVSADEVDWRNVEVDERRTKTLRTAWWCCRTDKRDWVEWGLMPKYWIDGKDKESAEYWRFTRSDILVKKTTEPKKLTGIRTRTDMQESTQHGLMCITQITSLDWRPLQPLIDFTACFLRPTFAGHKTCHGTAPNGRKFAFRHFKLDFNLMQEVMQLSCYFCSTGKKETTEGGYR